VGKRMGSGKETLLSEKKFAIRHPL